tara:strand:+ start:553 stop:873 length:321 start_codon:yes stop_codon:yes gene_type:complete
MDVRIDNKLICNARFCDGFSKVKGLMFSRKLKDEGLILNNASSIHMFFVFFSIDVVWLYNNKVVDTRENVKPFTSLVKPKTKANKVLELPLGKAKLFKLGKEVYFK